MWKGYDKICWTKSKTYSYLADDCRKDKKVKVSKSTFSQKKKT